MVEEPLHMIKGMRKLRAWNYKYLVSVEFEYPTDPAPGLKKSMEFIKSVLD